MKVQLQNTSFYPAIGGIENYLYYAARTLLELGHRPTILCSQHKPGLPSKDAYENIELFRYPAYQLPRPLSIFNLFYYIKKLQKFIKNIRDIDVVWARHPYCAYASCKALRETPVLFIQATPWPFYLKYNSGELNTIRKLLFNIDYLQNYYIEKKAMEMCDKIVVLSEMRMREISDFYNFPKDIFKVIPPGVDLEKFKPTEKDKKILTGLNMPEDARVVLSVSRLSPEKNVSMLIEAFAKINTKNTYLLIVGDGLQRSHLEGLAKKLDLKNIRFLGYRTDVEAFYSIADVFVIPSTYEGFGHVLLEAMSSGVPCIGLRSDYPRIIVASEEIIRDGENGYCIDPYSVDDLSEKIDKIISDTESREKMSRKAREICEKKYSWERHVKNILQLCL